MKIRAVMTAAVLVATLAACGSAAGTGGATASGETGPGIAGTSGGETGASSPADVTIGSGGPTSASGEGDQADSVAAPQDSAGTSEAGAASGAGGSAGSGFCAQLAAAEKQLDAIDTAAGTGDFATLKATIDAQIGTFQKLGKGAPDQVQPAVEDIVELLQAGQQALANASSPDATALSSLGTKLPGDLTALGNYAASNCYGG